MSGHVASNIHAVFLVFLQEKIALDQEMKRKLHEIQSLRDQVVSGEVFNVSDY